MRAFADVKRKVDSVRMDPNPVAGVLLRIRFGHGGQGDTRW